jgi:hypothetical protein
MISAPEGSFGSAARAAASSGVPDSAGAGFAGGRADSFCFGSDASGFAGAILSSDGEISFKRCDDGGFIVVEVSAANADKAKPAMTKPTPNDRMMLMLLLINAKMTTATAFNFHCLYRRLSAFICI